MGRGKIEIKKIENPTARQVTFSKRRFGLLKKAKELAILCEAEVAVVVFSSSGKLFEFASNCMSKTFARYQTVKGQPSPSAVLEEKFFTEMAALREENERLKLHNRRMMGMELSDLDLDELKYLENQLNEGISSVKDMKEKILLEQLEQSQMKVQELQRFLPATNGQSIACIHGDNQGRGKCNSRYKIAAISAVHNCANEKQDDSDTALHLGLAGAYNKRNLLERASKTY